MNGDCFELNGGTHQRSKQIHHDVYKMLETHHLIIFVYNMNKSNCHS